MTVFTPSNILSFIRGPLALLFLSDNVFYRGLAVLLAMITDGLDGYLARRLKMTSRLGTTLDPLMDKFFVLFILAVFLKEHRIQAWEAMAMLSRDFAILIFGFYLTLSKSWSTFRFKSIWSGKITTVLQFFILWELTFQLNVSHWLYISLILLGISALIELYTAERANPHS